SKVIGQGLLETLGVTRRRFRGTTDRWRGIFKTTQRPGDQFFGFTHRKTSRNDFVGKKYLLCRLGSQQCPGVTHVDVTGQEHSLDGLGEVKQSQQITGRRAGSSNGL